VEALAITERLRRDGVYVECDNMGRGLKAQMKYANKIGADYTLILGDSEIESGRAQLRDMKNSSQYEVELATFHLPECHEG
jgi:histidyl-tRNA synthetase